MALGSGDLIRVLEHAGLILTLGAVAPAVLAVLGVLAIYRRNVKRAQEMQELRDRSDAAWRAMHAAGEVFRATAPDSAERVAQGTVEDSKGPAGQTPLPGAGAAG